MEKRRVAIVYSHPLFAHGMACLLEADPRVQVAPVDASDVRAAEDLRQFQPQVLIVEHDGRRPAVGPVPTELLDGEQHSLLIFVGLRGAEMELFYNRRVAVATPDNLLEMVLEGSQ